MIGQPDNWTPKSGQNQTAAPVCSAIKGIVFGKTASGKAKKTSCKPRSTKATPHKSCGGESMGKPAFLNVLMVIVELCRTLERMPGCGNPNVTAISRKAAHNLQKGTS
jgi:hypothetical protein